jgi:hypothetical protein
MFLSVFHIWKQFITPVLKNLFPLLLGPKDEGSKLLLKMQYYDSYLLVDRLQTVRDSDIFQDSAQ